MLKTGLEFAPGTTEECQKLVAGLFQPGDLLSAYRMGRGHTKTSDLVLVGSEEDPTKFEAWERAKYLQHVRQTRGKLPLLFAGMATRSAHSVVQLPLDSEAMWLVIARERRFPAMMVLYATPYQVGAGDN